MKMFTWQELQDMAKERGGFMSKGDLAQEAGYNTASGVDTAIALPFVNLFDKFCQENDIPVTREMIISTSFVDFNNNDPFGRFVTLCKEVHNAYMEFIKDEA